MKTFAAINVGSYEQSLKIYTITKNSGIREVDWIRNRLDLGGTFATGKLSHEVMDELCAVLRNFVSIMEGYRVDDYRACATSAIRGNKKYGDRSGSDHAAYRSQAGCAEQLGTAFPRL